MPFTQLPVGSLVGTGALLFIVLYSLARGALSPLSSLPGPWHSRFTRLPLKLHILSGRRIHYIHELHQRYGPVVRIAPGEVAVADLDAFSQIHHIGSGFNKSAWYDSTNAVLPGATEPGIFSMRNPKAHAQRRRLFARPLSNTALHKNWEPTIRDIIERAVAKIKEDANNGEADILKWWTLMTTDVIAHLSFGDSFDMVGLGQKNVYVNALQNSLVSLGLRDELPWLATVLSWIPLPSIQQLFKADRIVFDHGAIAVATLRQDGGNSNLFSQMLAESKSHENQGLSDLSVRIEASNLLIAGSDTTAVSLTYLVWAALKRPDLRRRLEEEVCALDATFQDEDLDRLPLLNAVIDETLRLYGAAPGSLPRVVPEGGATLANHFIPAQTVVCTQAFTLHRMNDVFPRPLEFDETRFAGPQTTAQKTAFHPYGVGSRICVGIHLARMELRLAAAVFFRECIGARIGDSMTDDVMELENHFFVAPRGHRCNITLQSGGN